MSVRVVARLSLFFAVLFPPLASAQQHPAIPRQTPAAHVGACEAFIQSAKFPKGSDAGNFDAKDEAASVAAFHQTWVSYQRQVKLKQADFLNSVCLTEWDARISSIPPRLMEKASITVQPDIVWGDITSTIVRLKRAILLAEERGDTQENLEWWRSRLDYFQTSLTSKDPKNTVLPSFVDVKLVGLQSHTPQEHDEKTTWHSRNSIANSMFLRNGLVQDDIEYGRSTESTQKRCWKLRSFQLIGPFRKGTHLER
jgi:hypothetical protein